MESGQREQLLADLLGDHEGPPWIRARLLRSGEVAAIFEVSRRTVNHWAATGRLVAVRTPGGQTRFPADRVRALLAEMTADPARRRARRRGNVPRARKEEG